MSASRTDTTTATATNDIDAESDLPKDLPSAIEKVKELRAKRDQMFAQKDKTAKELEKLTKGARMATIRSLIPRELYKHQDTYDNEVDKVYNYKNMTDEAIADIYQTKLRSVDLGQKRSTLCINYPKARKRT